MKSLKKDFVTNSVLAISLTVLAFYIENYLEVITQSIIYTLDITVAFITNHATNAQLPDNFSQFPVISFWAIVGILCYFIYLTLADVYYEINNYLVVKFTFVHGKQDKNEEQREKIKFLTRLFIHAGIVSVEVIVIAIFYLLMPVSELVRKNVSDLLESLGFYSFSVTALGFFASYLCWFFFVVLSREFYKKLKKIEIDARIAELHKL